MLVARQQSSGALSRGWGTSYLCGSDHEHIPCSWTGWSGLGSLVVCCRSAVESALCALHERGYPVCVAPSIVIKHKSLEAKAAKRHSCDFALLSRNVSAGSVTDPSFAADAAELKTSQSCAKMLNHARMGLAWFFNAKHMASGFVYFV